MPREVVDEIAFPWLILALILLESWWARRRKPS